MSDLCWPDFFANCREHRQVLDFPSLVSSWQGFLSCRSELVGTVTVNDWQLRSLWDAKQTIILTLTELPLTRDTIFCIHENQPLLLFFQHWIREIPYIFGERDCARCFELFVLCSIRHDIDTTKIFVPFRLLKMEIVPKHVTSLWANEAQDEHRKFAFL